MEYEGKFYSELYCQELGVSIATNSVSRLFNSLNTAISLISLVLLMDVAIRHRKRFICHVSLTLLIYNLFISSIAHVLVYFVAQVRYLTLSFTFTTPCSLFISKSEYAIVQIIFTYSIIWMENIQFALVVERVVASIFTEWYGTTKYSLGWFLSICCIVLTLAQVIYFTWQESFSVPTVNGLSKPATLIKLMNSFFIVSIATNGISLAVCVALYIKNKRENARRSFELSCRFQSEENASTAFLVCGILVTHYCVFLIYRSLYLLTNVVADTPRELEVYRSASHVLSLSPLLLGILTIWYFREVRRTRKMRITTLVSMQSNGADGWNNYASVLGSQWSRQ